MCASCSIELRRFERIDFRAFSSVRIFASRAASASSPFEMVVSEIAAPELLHDHLAPALAFDPFVVGRKAYTNGLHAARAAELNAIGRAASKTEVSIDVSFLLTDVIHRCISPRR